MAIDLHFLWNFSSVEASQGVWSFLAVYPSVILPAFIGVLALVGFSLDRERDSLRRHLAPELRNGLLSQEEYDALGTGRIGASVRALREGGIEGWRTHLRFRRTASRLAFLRERVSKRAPEEDAGREAAHAQVLSELKRERDATRHQPRPGQLAGGRGGSTA